MTIRQLRDLLGDLNYRLTVVAKQFTHGLMARDALAYLRPDIHDVKRNPANLPREKERLLTQYRRMQARLFEFRLYVEREEERDTLRRRTSRRQEERRDGTAK